MSLPTTQDLVLDAERVNDSTFRCYVYCLHFFALEVCPVLLIDEEPDNRCIRLLSCKLEGSLLMEAHNEKFLGKGFLQQQVTRFDASTAYIRCYNRVWGSNS
uniref:Uncharacterized protein n=1 Tax=Zea mays TaxID=4577 RepID=A0A804LEQ2_MAIZE